MSYRSIVYRSIVCAYYGSGLFARVGVQGRRLLRIGSVLCASLIASLVAFFAAVPCTAQDVVNGNLINFQSDGAWSWYMDERAIVTSGGKIITGTVAAKDQGDFPTNGFLRDPGDIIANTYDISTGRRSYFELNDSIPTNDLTGVDEVDDHNAASFLELPDGRILASYSGHSSDNFVRFRKTLNPEDTSSWTDEYTFTRTDSGVTGENDVTYTNLHYLPNEGTGQGRVYNFFRNELADRWDAQFAYSDDLGDSWTYGGQLTGQNTFRVRPYVKYVSNGDNRIYYTATEDAGRENIWAGYVEDGQTFQMDGSLVDGNLFDTDALPVNSLTSVMLGGTSLPDPNDTDGTQTTRLTGLWNRDIALDANENPVATFRGLADGDPNDSRHVYARWDGSQWNVSQLAFGGSTFNSIDANEQGGGGQGSPSGSTISSKLAVLDPNNPNQVYFSANVDPLNGSALISEADGRQHFEIFKAVTSDNGASWEYTQITENSSVDNVRLTVANWDNDRTAIVWMRGAHDKWDYIPSRSWYAWDTSIVGIIDDSTTSNSLLTYVDADMTNTRIADGTPWELDSTFTRGEDPGGADDLWHSRENPLFGNGGTLFTANERGPNYDEDTPVLETVISDPGEGTYDVFGMFWSPAGHPGEWRLEATLDFDGDGEWTDENFIAFDRLSSQHSPLSDFESIELVEEAGNRKLYRGYLGRTSIADGEDISVFINSLAQQGLVSVPGVDLTSTNYRTWFDGVAYSRVSAVPPPFLVGDINQDGMIDFADIPSFISVLQSGVFLAEADINGDGVVNFSDIPFFIDLLIMQ